MMDNWRYVEEFNADQELHRILPVGKFKRFGRTVEITPAKVQDMVNNFNRAIPDTGVPINAEHVRSEGRIGQVTGLQARPDGAYAALQFTDTGQKLMAEARFQYVSPEIVWGPTDWEQHDSVSNILVGLALTNSPFFGRDVSLFSLNDQEIGERFISPPPVTIRPHTGLDMYDGAKPIQYPPDDGAGFHKANNGDTDDPLSNQNEEELVEEQKFFEKFTQWLDGQGKQAPAAPPDGPTPEAFAILQKEKEELEAKLSKQHAEQEHAARVAEYSALVPAGAPEGLPEDLAQFAAVNPEAAKRLVEEYAALRKQADEGGLFSEKGSGASHDEHANEVDQFNALVAKESKEKGISLVAAMENVGLARPELLEAVRAAGRIN